MPFPKIQFADVQRAWQIFRGPQFESYIQLELDIRIAKKAVVLFAVLAAMAVAGLIYSAKVGSTPTAAISGVLLLISLIAIARFGYFAWTQRTYLNEQKHTLPLVKLALMDWEDTVPDSKFDLTLAKGNEVDNLISIGSLLSTMDPHSADVKCVIRKCWIFALRTTDHDQSIQYCLTIFLNFPPITPFGELVEFRFIDGTRMRIPYYLWLVILEKMEQDLSCVCSIDKLDYVNAPNMTWIDFITSFRNHFGENVLDQIPCLTPYNPLRRVANDLKVETTLQEQIAILKTLSHPIGPETQNFQLKLLKALEKPKTMSHQSYAALLKQVPVKRLELPKIEETAELDYYKGLPLISLETWSNTLLRFSSGDLVDFVKTFTTLEELSLPRRFQKEKVVQILTAIPGLKTLTLPSQLQAHRAEFERPDLNIEFY